MPALTPLLHTIPMDCRENRHAWEAYPGKQWVDLEAALTRMGISPCPKCLTRHIPLNVNVYLDPKEEAKAKVGLPA